MTHRLETDFRINMNNVLNQLVNEIRCQCCGNVLDGSWWGKHQVDTAKPSYIQLEFCSFVCERTYNDPWGYQRNFYDRTTKF